MSVRRAREEIDAEEFANWLAYFELETWDFVGYHQAGIICASIANMLGGDKIVAGDFMPLKASKAKGMDAGEAQQVLAMRFGS